MGLLYKLLAKAIALRISPFLRKHVHAAQSGFIAGRSIFDNILTKMLRVEAAQNSDQKLVLLQLDFAKAFDIVLWDFVVKVMAKLGFGPRMASCMLLLGSGAASRILVNGRLSKEVPINRRTQSFLSANGSVDADERVAGLLRYMIGGSTLFYPQLASLNTYQFFIEVVCEEMDWLPLYPVSSFKWSTNAEHDGFPHKGLGADVRRGAQELDGSKEDLEESSGPIDEKHVMENRSMKPSIEEINTTHTRFHPHIKESDMTPLSRSIGLYRTAFEAVSKLSLGSATGKTLSMEFDAMLAVAMASGIQQASTLEDQRQEQLPEIQKDSSFGIGKNGASQLIDTNARALVRVGVGHQASSDDEASRLTRALTVMRQGQISWTHNPFKCMFWGVS
ncbi:hypothetical protein L7F22_040872 [Adiantum nelumboides]|nr:hypothetical protein [Adiantum nelumboides]